MSYRLDSKQPPCVDWQHNTPQHQWYSWQECATCVQPRCSKLLQNVTRRLTISRTNPDRLRTTSLSSSFVNSDLKLHLLFLLMNTHFRENLHGSVNYSLVSNSSAFLSVHMFQTNKNSQKWIGAKSFLSCGLGLVSSCLCGMQRCENSSPKKKKKKLRTIAHSNDFGTPLRKIISFCPPKNTLNNNSMF